MRTAMGETEDGTPAGALPWPCDVADAGVVDVGERPWDVGHA